MTMESGNGSSGSSSGRQEHGKSVCVYCGSSFGTKTLYSESAEELGALFYKLGWQLVYGGGTTGLMGKIARSTMGPDLNGQVHGIIPDALVSKERTGEDEEEINEALMESVENHKGSTPISKEYGETTIVPDMHTRKRMMANLSDAFVAMPGGYGTFEEIMECITWSQLGIHNKPIILFNIDGFYDQLLQFINHSIEEGFISAKNGEIVQVASTSQEVVDKIERYVVPEGRFNLNWNDEGRSHEHCAKQ
ncbi:hypothetical protein SEUBUCD646_0J01530 [Saccharomyces eubayanus]|uniref:Uncharacterized protein n=2 Tax=Saccharomyces TaxID=4930 RepID=A0A6C1EAJ9_SACPS|nr:hypothetical protein DI49_2960 [Saccharomyces eubayanus]KOG98550.1 hypothetical protein DI49_2960 [Saccharomyces eubayanus]QID86059.1 hypothetical protein GRS66_008662 [Saccharomyces pastorianus]CAI1511847.1 hypothetical protein SEUBUCD650_0J01540 [Saccharomyces eubayanus]CAI1527813.1 hypothetical protein SEUBUCD646_0J01530 [Saccharomyces eubayanus]